MVEMFLVFDRKYGMLQLGLLTVVSYTNVLDGVGSPVNWTKIWMAVFASWWVLGPGTTILAVQWTREKLSVGFEEDVGKDGEEGSGIKHA